MVIILQAAAGLAAAVLIGLMILQVLKNSGVPVPGRIGLLQKAPPAERFVPSNKEMLIVMGAALAFRVLVYVLGTCQHCIEIGSWENALDAWRQWDVNNYIRIAEGGYTFFKVDGDFTTVVFLPLYPLLARGLNVFVGNMLVSLLLISSFSFAAACGFLYRLICLDWGKKTAAVSLVFLSIFPFSFFFGTGMNEITFLLMSAACLYFTRKHNWFLAGVFGFGAALTRTLGVFLAVTAAVEFAEHYRLFEDFPRNLKHLVKYLWILLIPLGTLAYLAMNWRVTGNALDFLRLEEEYWFQHSQPFTETIEVIIGQLKTPDSSIFYTMAVPGIVLVVYGFITMFVSLRTNRSLYTVYFIIYYFMNLSLSWPISIGRYFSCIIPMFIVTAQIARRYKIAGAIWAVIWAVVFCMYLPLYLRGGQLM